MDPRDVESDAYGDEHAPPSYYGEHPVPKVQVASPLLSEQGYHPQMHQPGQMGQPMPRPGDQVTVVTMAAKPEDMADGFGCCHVVCSFLSVFLCFPFGLIALVLAMMGYTDYRTAKWKMYKKKRKCAIVWTVLAWLSFGVFVGLMYYLGGSIIYQFQSKYQSRQYDYNYGK